MKIGELPIIDIRAELFRFIDIDNQLLAKEMESNTERFSYSPNSVAYEDRVINYAVGSECEKLLNKVREIGAERGLELVHYHLLSHEPLESTNTHHHINTNVGIVASWVYYVNVSEGAGNLVFLFDQYDLGPSYIHEPSEGTMVMFPPYVLHKVTKNMSNQKRISIAGDFAIKRG